MQANKVALVTGSGRGIGRAIAIALAECSWSIVINDIGNPEPPQETLVRVKEAGGTGIVVLADITSRDERERLVQTALEAFGRIDLLVNNAGIAPRQRRDLLEMSEESYEEVMAINLKAPLFLSQQVARAMLEQIKTQPEPAPKIVNIGSLSAYAASVNRGEYCISKAGLAMVTALFADRLADSGILVYEIRPGIIQTDMTSVVKEKYDRLIGQGLTPIRRWGQPSDIARAVVAIAEGFLPFSTGEVINIDGGFHLRRL
jgi:NAD(P)-dependent dehydrogenase (short-subunit alcohol dehydrogenase family)